MRPECETTREVFPWLREGGADEHEAGAAWMHLATCPDCRADLAAEVALRVQLRQSMAQAPEPADTVWQAVAARLDNERPDAEQIAEPMDAAWRAAAVRMDNERGSAEQMVGLDDSFRQAVAERMDNQLPRTPLARLEAVTGMLDRAGLPAGAVALLELVTELARPHRAVEACVRALSRTGS